MDGCAGLRQIVDPSRPSITPATPQTLSLPSLAPSPHLDYGMTRRQLSTTAHADNPGTENYTHFVLLVEVGGVRSTSPRPQADISAWESALPLAQSRTVQDRNVRS